MHLVRQTGESHGVLGEGVLTQARFERRWFTLLPVYRLNDICTIIIRMIVRKVPAVSGPGLLLCVWKGKICPKRNDSS